MRHVTVSPTGESERMDDTKLEEQDTAGSRLLAGHGITTGRAARIAWHRARGLSMVSRVPVLGAVITPWLWPMHLAGVAAQNDQIRYRGSASMAVSDVGPHTIHRPAMALAAAALLIQFVLLVSVAAAAATMLLPLLSPAAAAAAALLVIASPLLLEGPVRAVIRLTRDRESLTLNRRRNQLAEHGPAFVMSSFVRSANQAAAGEGRTLLDTMKTEWRDQHAAIIFYPANNALVRYYANESAVIDTGAKRLMRITDQRPAEQSRRGSSRRTDSFPYGGRGIGQLLKSGTPR
jgi:hypothetical protein